MLQERELLIILSTKGLTYLRYQMIIAQHTSLLNWRSSCLDKNEIPKWLKTNFLDTLADEYQILLTHNLVIDVGILTVIDKDFPECLQIGADTPLVLYFRGNKSLLAEHETFLTIIGSRNHSMYAQTVISNSLPTLIDHGIVPVSGLAEGVDGLVHEQATKLQAPTIAVIGSGLDDQSFYPKSNLNLYHDILDCNGLVLSEYPIGYKANSYTFPQRNRILAALSGFTWVVEASEKSGSMTTVAKCYKYSKQLLVTPTNLYVQHCSGNIALMKQGAKLVYDAGDILQLYSQSKKSNENFLQNSTRLESFNTFLTYFSSDTLTHFDDIVSKSGLSIQECSSQLSEYELDGLVCHEGQNMWKKIT